MGDEKPKKKSFPPYVWIHIKDYMLQEYWIKQYNSALKELPKYNTFLYPKTSTKTFKKKLINSMENKVFRGPFPHK